MPNQTIIYDEPYINKDDVWAIREGASDSIAFGQEETATRSSSHSGNSENNDDDHDDDDHEHDRHHENRDLD